MLLFLLLALRYFVLGESIQWAPAFTKYPAKGSESYRMIIYIVVWLWRILSQKPLPTLLLLLLLLSSGYYIRTWREYIVADCCRDEGTREWYCLHTGINKSWWVVLYAFILLRVGMYQVLIMLGHFFFSFLVPFIIFALLFSLSNGRGIQKGDARIGAGLEGNFSSFRETFLVV